ncbi:MULTISPECIES: hypothetical protein [Kitasatospora]|uniref:PPE family domain-containing protein n=1 Tax=Kitasatospora setae (strain ATCC 33774 / DSM 43861 / JCM 3304 / KCC A-0304 / NBRC 14216 / KM-6054) TaxID=452652 RepID=E4NBM2_KITSK|nr:MULTISPECIES: hypothetical protein [Kitasatospora]BAJ28603.1 hypothetical protein KSE_27920 [Kitasatospora setae KM-6054]
MAFEEKRLVRLQPGEIGRASHEQLMAMVHSADPAAVSEVGQQLLHAAQQLDQVSEELHSHISKLDWEGTAADGFKTWGSQVSRATMDLASYSRTAGTYMNSAADTLSSVKAGLPPVPHHDIETLRRYQAQDDTAETVGSAIGGALIPGVGSAIGGFLGDKAANAFDPNRVSDSQARAASDRIFEAHQEAITQMERLSQSYEYSSTQLNSAQVPVFPPVPGGKAEGDQNGLTEVPIDGGHGTGGTTRPTPPSFPRPTPHPVAPPTSRPPTWSPPGIGPLPPPTPYPGPTPHPGPTPPPWNNPPVTGPGPLPTPHPTPTPTPNPPPLQIAHVDPPAPTSPIGSGGGGTGGSGGGYTGGGGGGYTGGGGGGYTGGGGGYVGGGTIPGGLSSAGGGSTAGGAKTGGAGSAGTPGAGARGGAGTSAAGAGGAGQAGRAGTPGMGGMGGAMGGGAGGGARGGAGGAGGARGSGMVSRAGGTVGGSRTPGGGRGEFTPGGTGLRGRAERGADGRAGQGGFGGGAGGGSANRKGKGQSNRPDYLTEDEDTWTSGMGPANPNVIE